MQTGFANAIFFTYFLLNSLSCNSEKLNLVQLVSFIEQKNLNIFQDSFFPKSR